MVKFVNESIDDILKPKTKDEIISSIGGKDTSFKKTSPGKEIGTYLLGTINTSYENLVKLFGEPQDKFYSTDVDIADKVSNMWILEDEEGRVYTIYDYKATNLFYDDLPSPEELRKLSSFSWHIGGKEPKEGFSVERLRNNTGAEDLIRYIYLNSAELTESIQNVLKPKSEDEIADALEDLYDQIAMDLIDNDDFDDYLEAYEFVKIHEDKIKEWVENETEIEQMAYMLMHGSWEDE